MLTKKEIPQFKNEDEEREFWASHDSTDYVDWNQVRRVVLSSTQVTDSMDKTGAEPELDARLCQLLEPMAKGTASYKEAEHQARLSSKLEPMTPLGFWRYRVQDFTFQPIPLSTDWEATTKAAVKLQSMGYTITIWRPAFDPWKVWIVELKYAWGKGRWPWSKDKWGWRSGCFHGDELSHVLALAACEALEREQ